MQLIDQTILFVKETLQNAEAGHDWFHIERVYKNALQIADTEDCDLEIVKLSALLHDIADSKFHGGDETIGPEKAKQFLQSVNAPEAMIAKVVNIIAHISYRGGHKKSDFRSKELDIVQDADRLDAIGAIGIARTFHYGGFKNRPIYDPKINPVLNRSVEDYKSNQDPTINHFYEKLLLLKHRMNTEKGKELAEKRHVFMERFLSQFYSEWDGES
ncbi:MAG: HD domain-containing protein [Flavobacterium sp.]